MRLHGEGGVYDLYRSQPPGGDQCFGWKWNSVQLCATKSFRAQSFTTTGRGFLYFVHVESKPVSVVKEH